MNDMQKMEQMIARVAQDPRSSSPDCSELAAVQDACRTANGAAHACENVQVSTNNICARCQECFRMKNNRDARNVTMPAEMIERMTMATGRQFPDSNT